MGEYDTTTILCSISGTRRFVCFSNLLLSTRCSDNLTRRCKIQARMRALFPASYPWIMWPSRRFLWEPPWSSGPQHCNTRACGSLYYQFLWLGLLSTLFSWGMSERGFCMGGGGGGGGCRFSLCSHIEVLDSSLTEYLTPPLGWIPQWSS